MKTGWRGGVMAGVLAALLGAGQAGAVAAEPFGIEVRFLGAPLGAAPRSAVNEAARRVSALIASPFEPVRVDVPAGECDRGLPALRGRLTRLVVFVRVKRLDDDLYATGMPCDLHDGSFLPIYGVVDLNSVGLSDLPRTDVLDTMIHEFLHVLGVGTLWERDARVSVSGEQDDRMFLKRQGKTTLYVAPRAVAAFRALGGQGAGIPLDPDRGHWAGGAVCSEVLSGSSGDYTGRLNPVSPLTLGALEDLGYRVQAGRAAPFRLPVGACPVQADPPAVPAGGFASCAAARAAGAALPLRRGQPGYRPELDGDGDGLACER
ncbi:excalibur calcium-binding domain-containing protein [Deinococcus sp. PEB2-63]